jgi:hypothetical protein
VNHRRRDAVAFAVASLLVLTLGFAAPAHARAKVKAQDAAAFTKTRHIARAHLVDGAEVVADSRDFTLTVDQTNNLRFFQQIQVSWSGARQTAGIVADPNSGDAKQQEYPVVLLQCRGIDAEDAPAGKRLDPTTCWTATAPERFDSSFQTAFPPWRLDRYEVPAHRTAIVGQPDPRPSACFSPSPAERWIPFVGTSGTVFAGGAAGCAGMAPEAANVGGLSVPSNTTYGVTSADGTGKSKFAVWTAENNASLGCSADVACALVAVPIEGISCDVAGADLPEADRPSDPDLAAEADGLCRGEGHFEPGQVVVPAGRQDVTVSGGLWWAASNWRNRITVPLSFAPSANVCDVVRTGARPSVEIYGAELMTQATLQWGPRFCLDETLFNVKHVQTGEIAARTLLASKSVDAVFSSNVPAEPFPQPVVNAPVALTGFAVAFAVDDKDGEPVGTLQLTPRLLAKLLTESYPAINVIKQDYAALATNPLNITLDPEFIALNPDVSKGVPASESASTLLTISSDSDVTTALTSYIAHDAEARKWLDGSPDPWGMTVNPNYKGMELPVTSWPLLDTFQPTRMYESGTNDCLRNSPVAYLPLVAAPMARLSPIAQKLQFALAPSMTQCAQIAEGTSEGEKLVPLGRQTQGHRFLLGVVALGDARRFALDTAALQTAGEDFVAPSDASLRTMGSLLKPDVETHTWPIPYSQLSDEKAKEAYPGSMLVYAQVPTEGLGADEAERLGSFLKFAATDGQVEGSDVGRLPPGYLPLTEANGLGGLAVYTQAAAAAVIAQAGVVPPLVPVAAGAAVDTASGGDAAAEFDGDFGSFGASASRAVSATEQPSAPSAITTVARAIGRTTGAAATLVAAMLPLTGITALVSALASLAAGIAARRRRRNGQRA